MELFFFEEISRSIYWHRIAALGRVKPRTQAFVPYLLLNMYGGCGKDPHGRQKHLILGESSILIHISP